MAFVDLHTHTIYSDGIDDPMTLVIAAKLKGIDALAITDHDIMDGYLGAIAEAEKWGLRLIPGVEVSTEKYHILGLNVDPGDKKFQRFLKLVRSYQKETAGKRIEVLQDLGVPITMEKLEMAFPESRLGRYNVFMTMVMDKECREYFRKQNGGVSPDEIYTMFFRKNERVKNVERKDVKPEEAIRQIHEAGGIAVIAHPFKNIDNIMEMDALVEAGLDGVEMQPKHFHGEDYLEYAKKKELMITYGSDYHGASHDRPLLGIGHNYIEWDRLEDMLNRYSGAKIC